MSEFLENLKIGLADLYARHPLCVLGAVSLGLALLCTLLLALRG